MRLWLRWTLAMLVAEAVGFGFAGLVGWGATLAWGDSPAAILLIVLAGGFEGLCVGLAQAWCIPRTVRRGPWVALTGAAALLAWTAGMIAGGRVPLDLILVAAPLLLLGMGALMGAMQWLELRRRVPRAWRWIPVNAVAWPLGLLWVYGASSLVDASTPMALGVALIVGSGLAMGLTVGVVTGLAMERAVAETSGRDRHLRPRGVQAEAKA